MAITPRRPFQVICEIEPPTRPSLDGVRRRVDALRGVADAFVVPDNHLGRATVSSVAVAREAAVLGGRPVIACLNARDRNVLGLRRDLLTAAAYGVRRFLYVYGDRGGARPAPGDLTVRRMLEETREFDGAGGDAEVSVASRLGPLPAWKRSADGVFAQVCFDVDALRRWRDTVPGGPRVYAGVMVLASSAMAARLAGTVDEIGIPPALVDAVDRDRKAGVAAACAQVLALRDCGAFDGVHLVPVGRYREVAAALEPELS